VLAACAACCCADATMLRRTIAARRAPAACSRPTRRPATPRCLWRVPSRAG
jgi:hypothetical protein